MTEFFGWMMVGALVFCCGVMAFKLVNVFFEMVEERKEDKEDFSDAECESIRIGDYEYTATPSGMIVAIDWSTDKQE